VKHLSRSRFSSLPALTLAVVALVLGGVGGATAATGGSFLLGKGNAAGQTTTLTNTGAGPALSLKTKSSTTPPLAVSNTTRVPNLNADLLDGLQGASLQRRVQGSCSTGITAIASSGQAACQSAATMFATSGDHTYMVPAGAKSVLVQVWGAGGGGGYNISWAGSSGGGQGSYVEAVVPVSPAENLVAHVGAGGTGGGTQGNGCCFAGTAGADSTVAAASKVVVTALGGSVGATANTCPNSGVAGGAGAGPGSVNAPAVGLFTQPGAAGGPGHADSGCGSGDGAGGAGGGSGFAGAGGAGQPASGNVSNGVNGANGLIIITVIG